MGKSKVFDEVWWNGAVANSNGFTRIFSTISRLNPRDDHQAGAQGITEISDPSDGETSRVAGQDIPAGLTLGSATARTYHHEQPSTTIHPQQSLPTVGPTINDHHSLRLIIIYHPKSHRSKLSANLARIELTRANRSHYQQPSPTIQSHLDDGNLINHHLGNHHYQQPLTLVMIISNH